MTRKLKIQVDIAGDPRKLEQALRSVQSGSRKAEQGMGGLGSRLQDVGSRMASVGGTLTRRLTLPLVGIGVAAVKSFTDFETSMAKIGGLVLGTTEGLDELKSSVLGLARETGRAPQELAEAMFAVQSAGLRGEQAMDALRIAAKASAAGLGDTKDVALAAAASMTAYQKAGLTAERATDILTATVREGNLEASELAGSLGKVIGVASNAGVSLDQVGAAVALITRQGGSASEAVTQVAAAVKQLNAPTAESVPLLEKVFGSLGGLRDTLAKPDGLLVAFRKLASVYGDQPEKLRKLVGSSEALNAVFAVTGQEAKEVDRVFAGLASATGDTQKAFDIASDTAGFKFQAALTSLKTAGVEMGASLTPVLTDLAGRITSLAQGFSKLDPSVQKVILGFVAVGAALGPVLSIVGNVTKATGKLISAYGRLTGASHGAAAAQSTGGSGLGASLARINPIVAAVGLGVAGLTKMYLDNRRQAQQLREVTNNLAQAFAAGEETVAGFTDKALRRVIATLPGVSSAMVRLKLTLGDVKKAARQGGRSWDAMVNRIVTASGASGVQADALRGSLNSVVGVIGTASQKAAELQQIFARPTTIRVNLEGNALERLNLLQQRILSSTGGQGLSLVLSGRAHGGPVKAGVPYLVGERGPEMVVPDRDGTVVPNHALRMSKPLPAMAGAGAMNGSSGGGRLTVLDERPIVIQIDGRTIAEVTRRELVKLGRGTTRVL